MRSATHAGEVTSRAASGADERDRAIPRLVIRVDRTADEALRVRAVAGRVTVFCQGAIQQE